MMAIVLLLLVRPMAVFATTMTALSGVIIGAMALAFLLGSGTRGTAAPGLWLGTVAASLVMCRVLERLSAVGRG
jgi:hypothetical protein